MSDIPNIMSFMEELLELVPELKPVYDEHIKDNDEILSHLLLGDITRYVVQQLRIGATDDLSPLIRCLDFFEVAMVSGDESVQELISVSFLENVVKYSGVLSKLKDLIGENLTEELRHYTE